MEAGRLVLIRHGESVWNAEGRFAGASDVPLSAKGKGQAMAAALMLREHSFDLVFTSTMERARHTWELMASLLPPVEEVQQQAWLNERNFGLLEGQKKEALEAAHGAQQVLLWRFGWNETLPEGSGETYGEMRERVLPRFEENVMPLLLEGKHILMVGHGQVLRCIAMHLEDAPPAQAMVYSMDNAKPLGFRFQKGKALRMDV